jgi:hypothetical protein
VDSKMSVMEQVMDMQDRVLSDMQSMQERVIDLNKRAIEATSSLPSLDFSSMPAMSWVPDLDEAPKADALVSNYFEFAGKMLEANRAFTQQLVGTWVDVTPAGTAKASK